MFGYVSFTAGFEKFVLGVEGKGLGIELRNPRVGSTAKPQ